MNNYQDARSGMRIKLLSEMKNINFEDVEVETEGTITGVQINGNCGFDRINVKWDNGRSISLCPYQDKYIITFG